MDCGGVGLCSSGGGGGAAGSGCGCDIIRRRMVEEAGERGEGREEEGHCFDGGCGWGRFMVAMAFNGCCVGQQ